MPITTTERGLVTVFGGSGFLGRHLVRALLKRGWRVRAAVRRPDLAGHLQPLGGVGWVQPIQANLRYRWSVDRAVADADAVVNLVAILAESRRQRFDAVHVFGARAVAEATRAAGIGRLVHVSAIGADAQSHSAYARSKAAGEAAVFETLPAATVFRPSIMFGPEDHFFNRFAGLARFLPAFPLFGGGHTRFQPVFVGDVAAAIADAVEGKARGATVYELGGPEVTTFRQLIELTLREIERRRLLIPLPWWLTTASAAVLERLPGRLLTVDQVRQLKVDNVVSEAARAEGRTLEDLGIDPLSLAAILPSYLSRFRRHGQFERRQTA
ncbi:MAG: complex I NDUFA9 subunit family protein [Bauldia sp.]